MIRNTHLFCLKSFSRAGARNILLGLLTLSCLAPSAFAETYSLDRFLRDVKEKNTGIQGAQSVSEGSFMREDESDLVTSPTAFLNAELSSDAKLTPPVFLPYDRININTYSIGISKVTTFGLQAKLHYDLSTLGYTNPILSPALASFGSAIPLSIANASPVLELSQSIWGNGFGRGTRAQIEVIEAQNLANAYGSKFQVKTQLASAEQSYWRLALARQSIAVQKEALDRAQKIFDWTSKQSKLHLREQSDVLQAQALRQARVLDLAMSKTEERSACRAFNTARNIESEQVDEALQTLEPDAIEKMALPEKADLRDDVRAAKEITRATAANNRYLIETGKPKFEVYARVALNGQSGTTIFGNLSDAVNASFTLNRPSQMVGIRFSAPLAIAPMTRSFEGLRKEAVGSELAYQRKLFEQEQSWKDLNGNYKDAKNQLELAVELESIQKTKLQNERDRLLRGRTTTYQVLLFEQEYLAAQLTRIRSQAAILTLMAQMKLFGEGV